MKADAEREHPVRAQEALLERLTQAAQARAAAIATIDGALQEAKVAARDALQAATERAEGARQRALAVAQQSRHQRLHLLQQRYEGDYRVMQQRWGERRDKINARVNAIRGKAKRDLKESSLDIQNVFDATKHRPRREFQEAQKQVDQRAARLEALAEEAKHFLFDCRLFRPPQVDPEVPRPATEDEALQTFLARLSESETKLAELTALKLPRFFAGGTPVWAYLALWLLLAYPAGHLHDWDYAYLASSGGAAVALGTLLCVWLYALARRRTSLFYDTLCQQLLEAEQAKARWLELAVQRCQRETTAIVQKYQADMAAAKSHYETTKSAAIAERDQQLAAAENEFGPPVSQFEMYHSQESVELEEALHAAERQADEVLEQALALAQQAHDESLAAASEAARHKHAAADQVWQQAWLESQAASAAIAQQCRQWFPPWKAEAWQSWPPPKDIAPVIRFGQYAIRSEHVADDLPKLDDQARIVLPALLEFPDRCSLMIRAGGAGRVHAVDLLQAVMMRFLTSIPPGKVRYTIVDPVGLGQNFAGFMHLADYDELLVTHKIWTEPQQIEQRLAELSSHMANVIQKYLRNEFETIDEYNVHAGEVAEPYRVVVVANFPFNFTEAATRHLVSIATTGARCGVYTLISIDPKLPLPHGFRPSDLEQSCIKLVWRENGFARKDDTFERFPLLVDGPPEGELFSQIVHQVGEAAKDANRVEVPFEFIAPAEARWWTHDSRAGVDIPLGRAGATKRQHLQLGRGTSQHVLIAGKTGSGKSTLLHALITNAALMYSPDELELYLIDFKKGVEFKVYAEHRLPHARVIAIESEREFGLSVLQRLDVELKERGEKFREHNVQDLGSYRDSTLVALPRILLLVDEFQEFFVEDDKIAQDVSLLMDRLVRQGRAFGIHVHLGSQTLGGTYSLARSTLGQMAIRIALQCSEADSTLILSEENPAARLLTRPGEAIYNDANGRAEGNHLFQVVWLGDERREQYLKSLSKLAAERHMSDREQIVFEGNLPADVQANRLLRAALAAEAWPARALAATAWLGEAIAIKDPTACVFRAQSGNHVVLIGQQSEAALGLMATMIIGIAVQQPPLSDTAPQGARFVVLDGQAPDATHAGLFPRLKKSLPHPLEVGSPRDTARLLDELSAELERRQSSREADLPPVYLFIYDIQRFRELRKAEEDFGFGREAKASPSKQLVTLLREGPALGMHVILWADSLTNMQRSFERGTIREFETRVLFQMSVSDSSTLIDSPQASKLGPNRALLHSEEQGRLEKFRPYNLPDDAWLTQLSAQLQRRGSEK